MDEKKELHARLVRLLGSIRFAQRYYAFCDAKTGRQCSGLLPGECESALAATALDFKYDKRERFYGHDEKVGACELIWNAAFSDASLELILVLKTPTVTIGGTFHGLALEVARLQDPKYRHEPPYPRLPFGSREELGEAVRFGLELYREARDLILKDDWGC